MAASHIKRVTRHLGISASIAAAARSDSVNRMNRCSSMMMAWRHNGAATRDARRGGNREKRGAKA